MRIIRHNFSASEAAELNKQLLALNSDNTANLSIAFGSVAAINALAACGNASGVAANWVATSSCLNAFSDVSPAIENQLSTLQFFDPDGAYGLASRHCSTDTIVQESKMALLDALQKANRPGELPSLIWCSPSPGLEEGLLTGIRELVGDNAPVFGGSCADDDVSGNWCMFDGDRLITTGFIIAVLFSSVPVSYYFSCGYETTGYSATVTAACGRKLISLADQPAASVYNNWRNLTGKTTLPSGTVLAASTFSPLGRLMPQNEMNMVLLSHPAIFNDDGSIDLFSEVNVGEQVTFMQGDAELLIERAAGVSDIALRQLANLYDSEPHAAIMIFCAGCMLAIQNDITKVQQGVKQTLGEVPFIGGYTFGQQGRFADTINRHGNLMISAVIFGGINEPG